MEPEVTKPADGMTDYGLIELSGSENTRDQGGMETVTGQRVRAKKLIRSDKLEKLTDHDIHVLVDEYELRTVIDLRTDKERELSPDPTSRMPEVKFVNLPVFTEGAVGITHEHDIRSLMKEFSQMKEDPYKIVRNIYPMALLGDEAVKAYKQFFDILLEQEEGAILWHCSEGKDRTGLASLLILHALGVPPETIMEDYLATNIFARKKLRRVAHDFEHLHLLKKGDEALLAFLTAEPGYFNAACEAAEEKYGSLDSYLEEGLGITPEKRARLAEKYLF